MLLMVFGEVHKEPILKPHGSPVSFALLNDLYLQPRDIQRSDVGCCKYHQCFELSMSRSKQVNSYSLPTTALMKAKHHALPFLMFSEEKKYIKAIYEKYKLQGAGDWTYNWLFFSLIPFKMWSLFFSAKSCRVEARARKDIFQYQWSTIEMKWVFEYVRLYAFSWQMVFRDIKIIIQLFKYKIWT